MPTDNPKISLYVPQVIYDRFSEFAKQQGLSMSQAGIVVLAEYFGLQEALKETTEGTTIGGVTLDRVEKIERRLEENIEKKLEDALRRIEVLEHGKPLSGLQGSLPLNGLLNDELIRLTGAELAQRLQCKGATSVSNKSRDSHGFKQWSKSHDPDDIAWVKIKVDGRTYYTPDESTPSELLSKLKVEAI